MLFFSLTNNKQQLKTSEEVKSLCNKTKRRKWNKMIEKIEKKVVQWHG